MSVIVLYFDKDYKKTTKDKAVIAIRRITNANGKLIKELTELPNKGVQ